MSSNNKTTIEEEKNDKLDCELAKVEFTKNVPDDQEIHDEESHAPDGGWGWVVVFSSFMCNAMIVGLTNSFGVFLDPLVEFYNSKVPTVSLVGSLMLSSYMVTCPLSGYLTNKYGFRVVCIVGSILACLTISLSTLSPNVPVLMVTYGVLGGCSLGLIYLPAVVAVGHYFEKRRALATGITVCGAGVGAFVYAPLANYLEQTYGWQKAILILGFMYLICILFGYTMRPLESKKKFKMPTNDDCPSTKENLLENQPEISQPQKKSIIKNPNFLLVAISNAIANVGIFVTFIYLPNMAMLSGFSKTKSSFLLSCIAITNSSVRIIIGFITDIPWVNSLLVSNLSILLLGISTFAFPFCNSYAAYVIAALSFGAGMAAFNSLASIVMVDLLGLDNLNISFGLLYFFRGIGILVGPPVAGAFYDATQSYDVSFFFGGGVLMLASVIGFLLQLLRKVKILD